MLTYIELAGYKSISTSQRVQFKPLTVLSGANSSGKSSIMQPLLLLKQTLESPFDAGPLMLDGANLKITASEQILSKIKNPELPQSSFSVTVGTSGSDVKFIYKKVRSGSFRIESQSVVREGMSAPFTVKEGQSLTIGELRKLAVGKSPVLPDFLIGAFARDNFQFFVARDRCFLKIGMSQDTDSGKTVMGMDFDLYGNLGSTLKKIIHVPGLRGNPERTYRASQVSNQYPGTYESYIASIISMWQESGNSKLSALGDYLRMLGLTWKVAAKRIQDTRVELRVGRLPQPIRGGAQDMVSIADVGLGVAQVLPILVALLSAGRGQVVYIEQPELHLHPRAQWKLAEIFRDAVNRGVQVIVETHSAIFLRGLQTEIASSNLAYDSVGFVWFTRDMARGETCASCAESASDGSFGEWPADFDETMLEAESKYLDSVEL